MCINQFCHEKSEFIMLLACGVKCFDLWSKEIYRTEGNFQVDSERILASTQG